MNILFLTEKEEEIVQLVVKEFFKNSKVFQILNLKGFN